jgi:hypothetical protein
MSKRLSLPVALRLLTILLITACDCGSQVRQSKSAIGVSPPIIDFGDVPVDTVVSATVEVRNLGRSRLTLLSATLSGEADGLTIGSLLTMDCEGRAAPQQNPPVLSQSACGRIVLLYAPIHRRALDATLTLQSDDPQEPEVTVAVKGFGIGAAIELCEGADAEHCTPLPRNVAGQQVFDFGTITHGTTATRSIWVRSTGATELEVAAITGTPAEAPFSWSPSSMPTLQPGTAGKLLLDFSPPEVGDYEARLHFRTNDPEAEQLDVLLLGRGAAPVIRVCAVDDLGQVDDATCTKTDGALPPLVPVVEFPPTGIGSTSTRTLRIFNDGLVPLRVYGESVVPETPVFESEMLPNPTTLEAGDSTDFAVRFTPAAEAPATATLQIANEDAQRNPLELTLQGTGISPELRICILTEDGDELPEFCSRLRESPSVLPALDFGHVPWFTRLTRQVSVENVGAVPLIVATPALLSTVTDFSFETAPAAFTLQPGEKHALALTFAPVSTGSVHADLQLQSNDVVSPDVKVSIDGFAEGPKLCFDPSPLDFGNLGVGQTRQLPLVLRNCGLVPFDLASLTVAGTSPTTTEFTLSGLPTFPASLPTGGTVTVQASYSPKTQRQDAATVTAVIDSATVTTTLAGRGVGASCSGTPPTAKAGPDRTVKPLTAVTLNGSGSTAPNGGIVYTWRFVSAPPNANPTFTSGATTATPTFPANLVGDYVVELVVRDRLGCQSLPSTTTVHVVPDKKIHVELSWAQDFGDMDLHYTGPGGSPWTRGDVYFSNKKPDWGLNNTVAADGISTNDPALDIDDVWGIGPENVTQAQPFDGAYNVSVHYFCSRQCFFFSCSGSFGPATATLRVYIDGVKQFEASQNMTQRDLWEAATITVSGSGANVTVTPLSKAIAKVSQGCTGAGN